MKTSALLQRPLATRAFQGVAAALCLAAASASASEIGQVSVYFVGKQITATSGFSVNSGSTRRIIAAKGYN